MLQVEHSGPKGNRLITTIPFHSGQVIAPLTGRAVQQPTQRSVQISRDEHLDDLGLLSYLNHSCQPSTILDTAARTLIAARDIAAGEELTFFHPSTEWDMTHPFRCLCGAPECIGMVAGAKHLLPNVLSRFFTNDIILAMKQAG